MATAYHIATRGTCPRKQVGAVVVDLKSKTIISTGYNGSLPKQDHCSDVGCHIENNHCIRIVYVEINAIN
jgi:dCMP deaminase